MTCHIHMYIHLDTDMKSVALTKLNQSTVKSKQFSEVMSFQLHFTIVLSSPTLSLHFTLTLCYRHQQTTLRHGVNIINIFIFFCLLLPYLGEVDPPDLCNIKSSWSGLSSHTAQCYISTRYDTPARIRQAFSCSRTNESLRRIWEVVCSPNTLRYNHHCQEQRPLHLGQDWTCWNNTCHS